MNRLPDTDLILAYIEGALDDEAAARFERKLAENERLCHLVNMMREDRHTLRNLPKVQAESDLVASLEPMIVRPILMDSTAGSINTRPGMMRRQLRRRQRRLYWSVPLAAAAGLALTAGAIWWAATLMTSLTYDQDGDAMTAGAGDEAGRDRQSTDVTFEPEQPDTRLDPGGVIHHFPTLAGHLPSDRDAAIEQALDRDSDPTVFTADFALVVFDADVDFVADRLSVSLDRRDLNLVLVRNFSYEEAHRLGIRAMVERSHRTPAADPVHVDRQPNGTPPVDRRGEGMHPVMPRHLELPAHVVEARTSGPIVGHDDLAPDLLMQLDFSELGAEMTLSVRAGDFDSALSRIAQVGGLRTALRTIGESEDALALDAIRDDSLAWIGELETIRRTVRGLPADTIIHLPVRIAD